MNDIKTRGLYMSSAVFVSGEVERYRELLKLAVEKEAILHNDSGNPFYGSSVLPIVSAPGLLEIFNCDAFFEPFELLLGDDCITYAMISASLNPGKVSYTYRIHRDTNFAVRDCYLRIIAILMLDDFTADNGAPYFYLKSHNLKSKPSEDEFFEKAVQITGNAGDVIYFDPLLWHSAGINSTGKVRSGILLGMVRPWLKQWIDIPKALLSEGVDTSHLSEIARNRLGYNHQQPESVSEFLNASYKNNWLKRRDHIDSAQE